MAPFHFFFFFSFPPRWEIPFFSLFFFWNLMNISRYTNVPMYTSRFVFLLNGYLLLQRHENVVISRKWSAEGYLWPSESTSVLCRRLSTDRDCPERLWSLLLGDPWTLTWAWTCSGCPCWERGWLLLRTLPTSAVTDAPISCTVNDGALVWWSHICKELNSTMLISHLLSSKGQRGKYDEK